MKLEYIENGHYKGTLNRHNGASILYGGNMGEIAEALIYKAFHDYDVNQPKQVAEPEPSFRHDEEAWTTDDWERDFVQTEVTNNHKDDDKI